MVKLMLIHNRKLIREYQLNADISLTIGRNANNNIVLQHPEVSRNHAKVEFREGRYLLTDLQSRNGTFVNREPVDSLWLEDGHILTIGDHHLLFVCKADESESNVLIRHKTKKCPFCAEEIRYEAIKCRCCGETLDKTEFSKRKLHLHASERAISINPFRNSYFLFFLAAIVVVGIYLSLPHSGEIPAPQVAAESNNEGKLQIENVIDEKNVLLESYFGDFRNATKEKESGNTSLEVWAPYIRYAEGLGGWDGTRSLQVAYDEKWILRDDRYLSPSVHEKYGDERIVTLYWKDNLVQACTVEQPYAGNPVTKMEPGSQEWKLTTIYDRYEILQKLQK